MSKTFGQRLEEARRKAGLTQVDVAEKVNCNPCTLNHWENDKTSPNVFLVADVAKLLNVSLDYLVFGKENNDV